jgi:SnoaL-like domain
VEPIVDASELDRLFAIEEIRQLKARYCRFVDTKQWQRLEELFMPEARLEGFGSVPDGSDPATFVAGVSVRLADAITIHHVHEPEVKLTDPGRARGIWPMMDYVDLRPTEPGENPQADRGWIGWGYYEEEY